MLSMKDGSRAYWSSFSEGFNREEMLWLERWSHGL